MEELLTLEKETPAVLANNQDYKLKLRMLPEVEELTNEITITDSNSILQFGQKPSEAISKTSDELLRSMKSVNTEEASRMLTTLTKIMDKFDIKEISDPNKSEGVISKIFNKANST